MSIALRSAVAAAVLAITVPAVAQTTGATTTSSTASSPSPSNLGEQWRWPYQREFWGYVGASVGRSDFRDVDCFSGFACDRTDTGFKIFAGGKMNNVLGLELSYINLGRADIAGGNARAQGANISLVAGVPIGDRFGLNGKVGTTYGWTHTSTSVPGYDSGDDHGWGLSYGVGASYAITRATELRLDWDRYRFDFRGPGDRDVDLLSAGINYKF